MFIRDTRCLVWMPLHPALLASLSASQLRVVSHNLPQINVFCCYLLHTWVFQLVSSQKVYQSSPNSTFSPRDSFSSRSKSYWLQLYEIKKAACRESCRICFKWTEISWNNLFVDGSQTSQQLLCFLEIRWSGNQNHLFLKLLIVLAWYVVHC